MNIFQPATDYQLLLFMTAKLNVNIDHVATVREARKAIEPSVITAAMLCEQAGAHGITVHLRSDRRHIQDRDVRILKQCVTTYLNVEMAATEEMVGIAAEIKPDAVTLVPESPNEITTEGGLDIVANIAICRAAVNKLREAGIYVSVFIDPDPAQVEAAREIGAQQIELCTGEYSSLCMSAGTEHGGERASRIGHELRRLRDATSLALQYGLRVAAGHGLTYRNVGPVAAIESITEFNIGHNIISRAMFVGIEQAVVEMLDAIR
jgi:pyridoxine 5-phosphate synthase